MASTEQLLGMLVSALSALIIPLSANVPCNNAQFISQSVPPEMTAGTKYAVEVRMKNTCQSTWSPAAGYRLGSQSPQDNLRWGIGRALLGSDIPPGGEQTFKFNVTAPAAAGSYPFQWRMLRERVQWFGEKSPYATVKVVPKIEERTTAGGRIGVRLGKDRKSEFYNVKSGKTFVPRGNNLIRLVRINDQSHHTTFDAGTYRASDMETALRDMGRTGYNVVRVFLNAASFPNRTINAAVADNFADFLTRAAKHGVYVYVVTDLPKGYEPDRAPKNIAGYNRMYLSNDHIGARAVFAADFARALKQRNAPLEQIFAYDIANELYFVENERPLSMASGTVSTATGLYDMARPADRERMMRDGAAHSINVARTIIRRTDPGALVTAGFFTPEAVQGADPRVTIQAGALAASTADFISIHPYLPWASPLETTLSQFGVIGARKPVIMGEFGAYRPAMSNITAAANELAKTQVQSCSYGIKGWLLWTWDKPPALAATFRYWTTMESGGIVNGALAPVARPDPCKI